MDGSCSWTGGSEPGDCTSFSGVLSYDEIQQKIADKKLRSQPGQAAPGPVLNAKTMMKYFVWGANKDKWIGYDDPETWQLKKTNLADKCGFGGTMFWSVDFLGQGQNTSDVYIDPALCAIPTTAVKATYTVSIEVYAGASSTLTQSITTTLTVTTDAISFSPVYVGGGRRSGDTFTPVPIIPMPSVVIPVTGAGVTATSHQDSDDNIGCGAWFLRICFTWPSFRFKGFRLKIGLPPGKYIFPPPDPGAIKPPPGIIINIKAEPHVTLTLENDHKWTTPQERDQQKTCQHSTTATDRLVSITQIVHVTGTKTSTETSTVLSTQLARSGCDVYATQTTDTAQSTQTSCAHAEGVISLGRRSGPSRFKNSRDLRDLMHERHERRNASTTNIPPAPGNCFFGQYCMIIPDDPIRVDAIDQVLSDARTQQNLRYSKIWAPSHRGYTGAYFLEDATPSLEAQLLNLCAQGVIRFVVYLDRPGLGASRIPKMPPRRDEKRGDKGKKRGADNMDSTSRSGAWSASQNAVPKGNLWPTRSNLQGSQYVYRYHSSAGQGQDVYIFELNDVPWSNHVEFSDTSVNVLPVQPYGIRGGPTLPAGVYVDPTLPAGLHSNQVAAMAVGQQLGVAKQARLWTASGGCADYDDKDDIKIAFWIVEGFVSILERVAAGGRGTSSVVNLSFESDRDMQHPADRAIDGASTAVLLKLHKLGVPIVIASGNQFDADPRMNWPQVLADPMYYDIGPNGGGGAVRLPGSPDQNTLTNFANAIMLVGATTKNGPKADFSQFSNLVQIHAPGKSLCRTSDPAVNNAVVETTGDKVGGTSFAGLVAYFRGLSNDDLRARLKEPRNVVKTIWNSHLPEDLSCLVPADVSQMTQAQENKCPDVQSDRFWDEANYWNDASSNALTGPPISWHPGNPSPVCVSLGTIAKRAEEVLQLLLGTGQCGTGCNSDWYCDDDPSGPPPFFQDPKDPIRQCHFHLRETFVYSNSPPPWDQLLVEMYLTSYDNSGTSQAGSGTFTLDLGKSFAWRSADSKLPADIKFNLEDYISPRKRDVYRPDGTSTADADNVKDCKISFSAGDRSWSTADQDKSSAAYCNVGAYDVNPVMKSTADYMFEYLKSAS
ncbi:hypothetical protein SBRCBS47491_009087 [Sporothrix bragantina]|uniref:GH18 domain-containing protein n=1 Tax=Sporothrix bragantina TaxID=671064 RepID=A0ABP0CV52_9PEZI